METSENINKLLTEHFSVANSSVEEPHPDLVRTARNKIGLSKHPVNESEDIFALFAAFLNLRIKLYHAVIATVLIYAAVLFFSREKSPENNELSTTEKVSNLATVRNSTVCSSIQTFISPK